ncbi:protein kinase domain-containing protein [Sorangium sp. So ce1000]|uniref:serine/threonine-protein kinase n=1 Tax=Sorangium sp. So ce1000 TaxID=3133325 RepID=UPI003F610EBD
MVAPVSVGDVLAEKYEVERVLGEGGMGVVVAARHLLLGERVAIKFLQPQARERADLVARFLREGQVAARIRSEHVTRVYDVGTLARGEPYLVMEYLEGTDLKAVLGARGPLPVDLACDYLLQACDALAEAHALGIIHRDLKPGNLFLTQRADGSPLIKVIDFGISKMALAEATAPKAHDMTESSAMLGSPFYMAPEQMVSSKSVDTRADVWSMGAMLYQLLTGAVPFRGESAMAIYDRILEGPPRLNAQRSDVPERLDWVIQRCLQKSPADRFGNIAELAAELAQFAPPHARHLAERAARVLQVRLDAGAEAGRAPGPARRSPSTSPGPAGATPSSSDSDGKGVSAGSAWAGAPTALLADGAATDRSWGGTRASSGRGGGARALGIAAALAAALVGAAGLAWLVWFALHAPASGVAPSASSAPSQAPEAPSQSPEAPSQSPEAPSQSPEAPSRNTAAPTVDLAAGKLVELLDRGPGPPPDAPVPEVASARPTASGSAAPRPPASSKGARPPGRPSTTPRPTSTAPQDLFSDPR